MTALVRMINCVKKQILNYEKEYSENTLVKDIIKDKIIAYFDPELNMYFNTEQIIKGFLYYEERGKNGLVFCISVPEETNVSEHEKYFNMESLKDPYDIKEEALSLGNTYEDWVNEEENKYYRREQKKNDSINFLKRYYPELLK